MVIPKTFGVGQMYKVFYSRFLKGCVLPQQKLVTLKWHARQGEWTVGLKVEEHLGRWWPEGDSALGDTTPKVSQPLAMLGDCLDSQHCFVHDMQLFGRSQVDLLSCLESLLFLTKGRIVPTVQMFIFLSSIFQIKICWVSVFIKGQQSDKYPTSLRTKPRRGDRWRMAWEVEFGSQQPCQVAPNCL